MNKGVFEIYAAHPLACRAILTFDTPKYREHDEMHCTFYFKKLNYGMGQVLIDPGETSEYLAKKHRAS